MAPEYVDHLLSSCTPLAATVYKQRHDKVASIVHWSLLKRYNLPVPPNYWNHTPCDHDLNLSQKSRYVMLIMLLLLSITCSNLLWYDYTPSLQLLYPKRC